MPHSSKPKLASYSDGPNIRSFLHGQIFGTIPAVTPSEITSQNLSNLTVIITGSNTGLGLEAAKQLVSLGCVGRLILACRSLEKGQTAKQLLDQSGTAKGKSATKIEVWELDMANLKSIAVFAERCGRELERIDCVVLNAGVDLAKYQSVVVEGEEYEMTVMVNVIGTSVLAYLMVDVLRQKASRVGGLNSEGRMTPPRITIVGSAVQFFAKYQPLLEGAQGQQGILKWLGNEKRWDGQNRYYLSKGMVQMLVQQLAKKISDGQKSGKGMVVLNCVAPGYCRTELFRDAETFASRTGLRLIGRDAHVGARSLVVGAVGAKGGIESHGGYMSEGVLKDSCSWFATKQGGEIGKMMWEEVLQVVEKAKPGATDAL